MSLRLVSDQSEGSVAAVGEDARSLDLAGGFVSSPPLCKRRTFARFSGGTPLAMLSLVVAAQALLGVLAVDSSGWKQSQALLAAGGALAVCFGALVLYQRQMAASLREQASHVYISTQRTRNSDGSLTVMARVFNGSDAPIWHVEVKPRRDGAPYEAALTQRLPDVLPAMFEEWHWRVDHDDAPHEERYPELRFLDARERRWRRIGVRLETLAS